MPVHILVVSILLIFTSLNTKGAELSKIVVGDWEEYNRYSDDIEYIRLSIKDDLSGVFATAYGKQKEVHLIEFKSEDIKVNSDYLEITVLDSSSEQWKFIVSAWQQPHGSLLTGVAYFYRKHGDGVLTLKSSSPLSLVNIRDSKISLRVQEIKSKMNINGE